VLYILFHAIDGLINLLDMATLTGFSPTNREIFVSKVGLLCSFRFVVDVD